MSLDYKYYDYVDKISVNHPSISRDSISLSSVYSPVHSTQSENVPRHNEKVYRSVCSEPNKTLLTEQELARHNQSTPYIPQLYYEEQEDEFQKMDQQCNQMKQAFEQKIKDLEAQLEKAEQDISQSRCDIEQLVYTDQQVQTDLCNQDITQLQDTENKMMQLSLELKEEATTWKNKLDHIMDQTRQLVWDTPHIPYNQICRQLPTPPDDNDICDYHRKRYETATRVFEKEKALYQHDHQATLNRLHQLL